MADVNISKYRASVVREGSTPASPGFVVSEGQNPVDPSGSGQNHLPVTITTAATGLSITDSQVLGGAGTVGQYIRGDGSLADFPESSGGGSSISYYLNGSVSQGTIGGVAYRELNKVPILGAGTDFTINADGYIMSFITDAGDPNLIEIPGGNWNFETYFSSSSSGGSPTFYVELYKVSAGGTATLIASNSAFPELIAFGTNIISYFSTLAVPTTALALTDRLAVRYYVTHSGRTITLHTENGHLCQIITTFTTGITALNGLTAQVQNFAVGTSGTDFAIASATATHTFNLPTASATNRGALSSADWTTFNGKTSNLGTVTSVGLSSATSGVTIGSTPVTTSGTITLAIATASGSQNGLLSSTDWTTFNSKQNALTNPVTGTGTTNYLPKFTGSTTIGNSQIFDNGTNIGIRTTSPLSAGTYYTTLELKGATGGSGNEGGYYLTTDADGTTIGQLGVDGNFVYVGSRSNTDAVITSNNTERIRAFAGGNVHIGPIGASDNGARLQVTGGATFSNSITSNYTYNGGGVGMLHLTSNGTEGGSITLEKTSGTTQKYKIGNDGTALFIFNETAVNKPFTILNNGNLLVGTTTDNGARLQVSGTATINSSASGGQNLRIQTSIAAGRNYVQWANGSGDMGYIGYGGADGKFYINNQLNDDMLFYTNSLPRLTISSTGVATFSSSVTANGQVTITSSNSVPLILNNQTNEQYFTISSASNREAMTQYVNATAGSWYTGIRTSAGIGSTSSYHIYSGNLGGDVFVCNTDGTSRFFGAVGIGVAPATNLHVQGSSVSYGQVRIRSTGDIGGETSINYARTSQTLEQGWTVGQGVAGIGDPFGFYTGGAVRLLVTTGGQIVMGRTTASASGRLTIDGDLYLHNITSGAGQSTLKYNYTSTGLVSYDTSSRLLKKNIEDLSYGLDDVLKMSAKKYNWKRDDSIDLGFIADEMVKIIPEIVFFSTQMTNQTTGVPIGQPLSINYDRLIPVLVKAIQELKQEIDTLKN